jgi:hypothetical protein
MPKGLDIMIAFISSTALIFNVSTYILPIQINRAFSNILTIIPKFEGSSSFDFAFNGRCYADDVRVSCMDSLLEISRAGSTGYDAVDNYQQGEGFYRMMKLVITGYSVCMSSHHPRV